MCALYGLNSTMCAYVRGGLGAVPNAFIDVNALCGSPPAIVDSIGIGDLLSPGSFLSKALDIAKGQKWSEFCECISPPPEPPPFQGGQCCDVIYRVSITYNFEDGSNVRSKVVDVPGKIIGFNRFYQESTGLIYTNLYSELCDKSGNFKELDVNGSGRELVFKITSITRPDGLVDSCGDPPGKQPPPPPARPLTPTASITTQRPPTPTAAAL